MNVHITIGSTEDRNSLESEVARVGHVIWPVPMRARMGDWVFFLIPYLTGDIVARGTVSETPAPSDNWKPKYAAKITKIQFLRKPAPIKKLRDQFPDWKYFTNAKGYTTVPEMYESKFLSIVSPAQP